MPRKALKPGERRRLKNAKDSIRIIGHEVGGLIGGGFGSEFDTICKVASCSVEGEPSLVPKWYAEIHDWINKAEDKRTREYHLEVFQKTLFKKRFDDYLEKFKPLIAVLTKAEIAIPGPISNSPIKGPKRSKSRSKSPVKRSKSKSKSPKRTPKADAPKKTKPKPKPKPTPEEEEEPSLKKAVAPVNKPEFTWTMRVHDAALHYLLTKILPELSSRWDTFHPATEVGQMTLDAFREFMERQFKMYIDLSGPQYWLLSGTFSNLALVDLTHASFVVRNQAKLYDELYPKIDIIREACRKEILFRGKAINPPSPRNTVVMLGVITNAIYQAVGRLGKIPDGPVQDILQKVYHLLDQGAEEEEEPEAEPPAPVIAPIPKVPTPQPLPKIPSPAPTLPSPQPTKVPTPTPKVPPATRVQPPTKRVRKARASSSSSSSSEDEAEFHIDISSSGE